MRNWRRRALAAALAALLALGPASAFADETEELEAQLEDLQRQAAEQQERSEYIESRIGTISEQLRELSESVNTSEKEYRSIKSELDKLDMRILDNQALLESTERELIEKSAQLRGRLRNIYMHGQISYLDVLFGAKDYSDLLTRMDLLKRVVRSDYELVTEVRAAKAQVESTRAVLEEERAQQAVLVKDAEEKHVELLLRKHDKDRLLTRMETDLETSRQAYEELLAASAEVENLIQQSRYTYAAASQPPTGGSGAMIWPIVGEITSYYGWREHPIYGDARYHSGMDIGGDYGDPIHAAAAGTVIYSGWISGYGYAVVIDHGGGISTLYGHNESLAVSEGQSVMQGQVIAYCGSTGNSTGPHCHFEVREGGEPVDPLGYL